jgi:hypothetical protein
MTFKMQFASLAISAMALSACGSPYYTADPIEAWVVDAETGKPIEGAVVTANWQLVAASLDTGGRKLKQLEVMETTTDKNGRFFFPGFTKLNPSLEELRDEDPQILIFKSGYRRFRTSHNYGIGKEPSGSRRSSNVNGATLRMPKANPDVKKYAFDLDFFATDLMTIIDGSSVERVQRMIHALACERKRLKAIDPNILFSVPGSTGRETNCES